MQLAFAMQQTRFTPKVKPVYETFEHTADLGLRVTAPNLPTLLAEAGTGLASMIVANLDAVELVEERAIAIEGADREYLIFDWLSELLYLYETRHLVLRAFDVQLTASGLKAIAHGERLDPDRHVLDHEVKAITYHQLKLEQSTSGWLLEVIVDI
jgi:SHS2 domain-containing protein